MVGEGHPYKYGKQVKEMNDSGKTMPLPLTSGKIIMFKHVEDRNSNFAQWPVLWLKTFFQS